MRIFFIDIDTLRPDHLGCYGYHRNTSPNIDKIAKEGVLFTQCFASDTPCLPSRAALHHGKFGIHNGAINHGGKYAEPYPFIPRNFRTSPENARWVQVLSANGYYTVTVSSFANRHDAMWFLSGFNEVHECLKGGSEIATEVIDTALEVIERHKDKENLFFHFNIWDPHTPYRTPKEYGNPFKDDPPPSWLTEEIIAKQRETYGQRGALIPRGWVGETPQWVKNIYNPEMQPPEIKNLHDFKKWIDGYDIGIRYADDAVGKILAKLEELGIYEDSAIIISSDHGENQGELNIYGDHQTADLITSRIPLIIKWPNVKPYTDNAFHYQFDMAATVIELIGAKIPSKWDGISFKNSFLKGKEKGRDFLVVSHVPWSCQRSVIFDQYILINTYMDGLKNLPSLMLFNLKEDPHETNNLVEQKPEIVEKGLALLDKWYKEMMLTSDYKEDPMMKVIEEGGPFHTRGNLEHEIENYKKIGREDLAKLIEEKYKNQPGYSQFWKKST